MRHILRITFRALFLAVLVGVLTLAVTGIPAPPSFVAQDVPHVSWRWAWRSVALVRRLQRQRTFAAWYGADRRMLVTLGTSRVLYAVSAPGAPPERVLGTSKGSEVPAMESRQRAAVCGVRPRSRRQRPLPLLPPLSGHWDHDTAHSAACSSVCRRTRSGRNPVGIHEQRTERCRLGHLRRRRAAAGKKETHLRGQRRLSAAGWLDDTHVLVEHLTSHSRHVLFSLDLNTGLLEPLLGGRDTGVRILDATHDRRDPVMYLAADLDGDVASLQALDISKGATSPLIPHLKWDVASVQALADGRTLALLVNEDAQNGLYLFDLGTRTLRKVQNAPPGFLTRIAVHPTLPLLAIDVLGLDGLSGIWTYDAQANRFEAWAISPAEDALPPPEVIHYPTFDQVDGKPRLIPAIIVRTSAHHTGKQPASSISTEAHGYRPCTRAAVGRHRVHWLDGDQAERARVLGIRNDLRVAGRSRAPGRCHP